MRAGDTMHLEPSEEVGALLEPVNPAEDQDDPGTMMQPTPAGRILVEPGGAEEARFEPAATGACRATCWAACTRFCSAGDAARRNAGCSASERAAAAAGSSS